MTLPIRVRSYLRRQFIPASPRKSKRLKRRIDVFNRRDFSESDKILLQKLYDRQDLLLEKPPKWMDNRTLGAYLEFIGDIYRELTANKGTRRDVTYIDEKVRRGWRALGDFQAEDLFNRERDLLLKDEQRLRKLEDVLPELKSVHALLEDRVYASILDAWLNLYTASVAPFRDQDLIYARYRALACALVSAGKKNYLKGPPPSAEAICGPPLDPRIRRLLK